MPPPHGATRYLDWGCRCEICRGANAARARAGRVQRRRKLAAQPRAVEHGTVSTYSNYGCRCDACRAAKSDENRRRPSRAKGHRSS